MFDFLTQISNDKSNKHGIFYFQTNLDCYSFESDYLDRIYFNISNYINKILFKTKLRLFFYKFTTFSFKRK